MTNLLKLTFQNYFAIPKDENIFYVRGGIKMCITT